MRMRRVGKSSVVSGLVAALIWAMPAFAVDVVDDPVQIDERATQLIQTTNLLCWEMHRYHQQQPDYREAYRDAKDLWAQAGQLRDALRSGTVETEVLIQKVNEMNQVFIRVENSLSKWGPGDRTVMPPNSGPVQRRFANSGVEVDIPFVGIRVGSPQVVVTDDNPPQLERRRLHPNSHGSKRALERELAGVKLAMNDLLEDSGVTAPPSAQPEAGPIPVPPRPDASLGDPKATNAQSTKKADSAAVPK